MRTLELLEPGACQESAEDHHKLGLHFLLMKKWTLAERHLRRTLALNPRFDDAHVLLKAVLEGRARGPKAV
jgi:hypothetical protein